MQMQLKNYEAASFQTILGLFSIAEFWIIKGVKNVKNYVYWYSGLEGENVSKNLGYCYSGLV